MLRLQGTLPTGHVRLHLDLSLWVISIEIRVSYETPYIPERMNDVPHTEHGRTLSNPPSWPSNMCHMMLPLT